MATNEPGDFLERLSAMVGRSAPHASKRQRKVKRAKARIWKKPRQSPPGTNAGDSRPMTLFDLKQIPLDFPDKCLHNVSELPDACNNA